MRRLFAALKDENKAYLMRQLSPSDEPGGATTAVDQMRLFRLDPTFGGSTGSTSRSCSRSEKQGPLSEPQTWSFLTGATRRRPSVTRSWSGIPGCWSWLTRNSRMSLVLAFNLAWVYHKAERASDALPLLQRCRAALPPEYSIAPKIYRLLGQSYDRLRRPDEAEEVFAAGQKLFPDDVELLLHYGLFLQSRKLYANAETCFRRILFLPRGNYPVGLDLGLLGYKTHNALAELYAEQKRWQESEAEWRAALADEPGFAWGKVGLATVALEQGRPREAADILDELGSPDSLILPKVERLRRRLAAAGDNPV